MIEDDEEHTIPRPILSPQPPVAAPTIAPELEQPVVTEPELDPAATIQVPLPQAEPVEPAATPVPEQTTAPPDPALALPAFPYMDVKDLLTLKIVSDPQIAPDGATIAFSLLHANAAQNSSGSAIWLVNSAGGKTNPPRQLTSGDYHDTMPRWSPDGHTLAFLSDRTGKPQLYLLSMQGGEARLLHTLPQGITSYSWRPDGQILLAHSYWKPADDQADAEADNSLTTVYTRLGEQWDGAADKHGRYQQLWLIPLEGNALRITSEPVDLLQSCWSPDGNEVAFCANRRADPDLSVSMALWVLILSTGQMRRLTAEEGLAQMPAWSPDGQTLAYIYTPDQTEASNFAPWIVGMQGNAIPQPAVAGAENLNCQTWITDELRSEWLARPQWYPDSTALLVPVQEHGQVHLYRLDRIRNSAIQLTTGNGRYISPQLDLHGQLIALVRADWFTPGDIWCMDREGKNLRKLTRVNDAVLQSHQLIRPKRISWQSFDNTSIEAWLYLPAHAGQVQVPLIVAVHGGPSLAWGDGYIHEFQVLAGRGYAVLAPNPRGSAGYGEEFSRHVLNDWGGDDFRDLQAGLDHVIATEPIDAQRLGIGGLSYGGYMTNRAITQTTRFKAAVSRNGISSIASASKLSDQTHWFNLSVGGEALQHSRSALPFADRITTPLLLLHADEDLRCPFSEAWQLFVALRKQKSLVELVRYHNASHLMDWPHVGTPQQRSDRLRRTVQWFERFV